MEMDKYLSPEAALKVASMNPSTAAAIKMAKMSIPVVNKFADTAMPLANKFAATAMPLANKLSASANNFASGLQKATAETSDKPDPPEISFIQQIRSKITNGEFPSIDFLPPFPAVEVLKIASSLNKILQNNLVKVDKYSNIYMDNETAKLKHKLDIENALAEEVKNTKLDKHVDKYIDHVLA